jgi:hypothetical protein
MKITPRYFWHNCNNKIWHNNVQMPKQIGKHAFNTRNSWYLVHKVQHNSMSIAAKSCLLQWEKSALDWVKCNVDVAFVIGSGTTSWGLCFRNNNG